MTFITFSLDYSETMYNLTIQMKSADQQHLLGSCKQYRILVPTPDLLNLDLSFQ